MLRASSSSSSTNICIGLVLFSGFAAQSAIKTLVLRHFSTSPQNSSKPKKSPLYTRTGDKGTSSLYNGERRSKDDLIFHALGHQDELNATLGIAREYCELNNNGMEKMIAEIQSRLFDVGAAIATPVENSSEEKLSYTKFSARFTKDLENWTDELDSQVPPLKNFVIPSGGLCSTHLNLSRAVCRRAERAVVPLVADNRVDSEVGRYLNRLSDLLFAASRLAAKKEGKEEILWKKAQPESE